MGGTGTDIETRTPPENRFEDYILNKIIDSSVGLTELPQERFTRATREPGVGGSTDVQSSEPAPIGFDFHFDGRVYTHFYVRVSGIMVIDVNRFFVDQPFNINIDFNTGIKDTLTTFSSGGYESAPVLLAPWFDNLRNVYSDVSQMVGVVGSFNPPDPTFHAFSQEKADRITAGLEVAPTCLNPNVYGVSYCLDEHSPQGKRFIVRWSSITHEVAGVSVLTYEVVLYENGTIEYRYAPRTIFNLPQPNYEEINGYSVEGATIGIWVPGHFRFRDFSTGLGYRENSRREYKYGGYVYDSTYTDVTGYPYFNTNVYTTKLRSRVHWPGLNTAGCILRFSPPKLRRKVLPRKQLNVRDSRLSHPFVSRTGDTSRSHYRSGFDDRTAPFFGNVSSSVTLTSQVNYPSTMPRFLGGNGLGTAEKQDLYAGDFLVTGSIVKSAIEQFIGELPEERIESFNESSRPEQGPSTLTNTFFTSGSNRSYLLDDFSQSLRSKTHVRFSLPVTFNVTMPSISSSIYYYNSKFKAWHVPRRSTYELDIDGTTPPTLEPNSGGGDWRDPRVDAVAKRITEDARGFGPIGNCVASGSHTASGASDQSDSAIGATYQYGVLADLVSRQYPKSIRQNDEYTATNEETFTIPITQPFLVEKAVFEIPLTAGPGWFNDKTQCFLPLSGSTTAFDFAGPALIVSLFRQVNFSESEVTPAVRDLILTGTITHSNDDVSEIVISKFPPYDTNFQIRPVGFRAYGGAPGGVVVPNVDQQFTGSVLVQAEALSSSGMLLKFIKNFQARTSASNADDVRTFLTQTPKLVLNDNATIPAQTVKVQSVSPYGRSGDGFQQAGRAILGNEYGVLQGLPDPSGRTVVNPFNLSSLTAQQTAALTNTGFSAQAACIIPLVSHFPSPYLLMPGDKLVLGISKMRPPVYGTVGGIPHFSGSQQHDIRLTTGNINVTLYGSLVKEGKEHHDAQNQTIGSDVVHEIIGTDAVVDQFEVAYKSEYSGSFTDNVMLGSLTPTSSRERKLSILNARNVPQLSTSSAETAINPYKSFRLRPWWESAGSVRPVQFIDATERFWDSMMPSIADCFAADGNGIFIAPPGTFGDFRKIDVEVTGTTSQYNPKMVHPGWIMMDNMTPSLAASGYGPIINSNWNKAFPFEPRYNDVSRQLDVSKSLLATYFYNPNGGTVVTPITPTAVNGLIFGTAALGHWIYYVYDPDAFDYAISVHENTPMQDWFIDSNLSSKVTVNPAYTSPTIPAQLYASSSATIDDTSRALFGFGDRNTSYIVTNGDTTTSLLGTNHFPDSKDVEGPHPDGFFTYFDFSNFRFSPVIRGWKYGVYSGLPTYSKSYWRSGRFGQFRDMLEQRPFTKYYQSPVNSANIPNFQQGVQPAAVTVSFVDQTTGKLTPPENTWSSNLHFECSSSLPFFDGIVKNRPPINEANLNLHPNTIGQDSFGNIQVG